MAACHRHSPARGLWAGELVIGLAMIQTSSIRTVFADERLTRFGSGEKMGQETRKEIMQWRDNLTARWR
jgi:hypothetical protein